MIKLLLHFLKKSDHSYNWKPQKLARYLVWRFYETESTNSKIVWVDAVDIPCVKKSRITIYAGNGVMFFWCKETTKAVDYNGDYTFSTGSFYKMLEPKPCQPKLWI